MSGEAIAEYWCTRWSECNGEEQITITAYNSEAHNYIDVKGTEDFIEVGLYDYSESYEWAIAHVFYSPRERMYFVYEDSGCSCNDPYDNITIDDFMNFTTKAVVLANFTGILYTDLRQEINNFDPRKVVA
jgi:hypothetical protein